CPALLEEEPHARAGPPRTWPRRLLVRARRGGRGPGGPAGTHGEGDYPGGPCLPGGRPRRHRPPGRTGRRGVTGSGSMSEAPSKLEAVRQARERLGEAPPAEVAAYVEANFGLKMQPAIAAVLLASLRERESLQASQARAMATIEQARTDQAASGQAGGEEATR